MHIMNKNINDIIRNIDCLKSLDEETIRDLASNSSLYKYSAGEQIFTQGDLANRIFIAISGLVKHYISSPKGQEVFLYLGLPTTKLIGISVVLRQENYLYTLETIVDTEVISIPADVINRLRMTSVQLDKILLNNVSRYILDNSIMLEQSVNFTSSERLACFFLRGISEEKTGKVDIVIPFKKQHIATLLGVKFETFSRSLKKLEPYGIKVLSKQVEIENITKTRELICSNCSKLYMNKNIETCPYM